MHRALDRLGTDDREHTVVEFSGDACGIDRQRKLERAAEGAVAALDAVVAFARRRPLVTNARNGQAAVAHLNLQVLASEARQFSGQDVLVGRLVQVDRRGPPGHSWRKAVEVLLNGQQVANGIPAREGHVGIVARI